MPLHLIMGYAEILVFLRITHATLGGAYHFISQELLSRQAGMPRAGHERWKNFWLAAILNKTMKSNQTTAKVSSQASSSLARFYFTAKYRRYD